jgi:hypothetical protein
MRPPGALAEWLGSGLQSRLQQFESARRLYGNGTEPGIRHSLMEPPNLDYADAKFMLVTCSAFVNYALAKAS